MKKIMGYEKFMSKKGTRCCAVSVVEEYKERQDVESDGVKAFPVMLYGESVDVIGKDSVGKVLDGFFGYSNGMCVCQSPVVA